jgi:hypothetical protein
LSALSKKYGVSVDDIAKASGIKDPNKLKIGQELTIPKEQTSTQGATFKKTPADSLQYGKLLPVDCVQLILNLLALYKTSSPLIKVPI